MSGEYPSDEELERITKWPRDDVHGLLDFIREIWHHPDWGWEEFEGRDDGEKIRVVHCSTGGWSGNEDIMVAFRSNFGAYHQAFDTYRRGGHYYFHLPTPQVKP
jgi:hypothetical protein